MAIPIVGLGIKALGGRLLKGGFKRLLRGGRRLGATTVGGAIARVGGATVGTAAVGRAVANRFSGPPSFGPQGIPRPPAGPVQRIGQRIIPGGKTGREFTPFEGAERDKLGRPIAVYPDTGERYVVPTGYVLVDVNGEKLAMLKGAARAMGLWKPRPKPPVSGWDMRAITRASSARARVKKLAGKVGLKTAAKGR